MYGIIYKAVGPTGLVYIGKTKDTLATRRNGHKVQAIHGDKRGLFQQAILEHGFSAFKDTFEQIDTAETPDELNQKEKYWINFYHSNDPAHGYNIYEGGDNAPRPESTRQKMSDSQKGKKKTPEHTKAWKESMNGKELRDFVDEGNRLSALRSPETKLKMKNSHLGKIPVNVKFNEMQIREIRELLENITAYKIAKIYNVTQQAILNIRNGKTYKWVD